MKKSLPTGVFGPRIDGIEERTDGLGGGHVAGSIANHQNAVILISALCCTSQQFLFAACFLATNCSHERGNFMFGPFFLQGGSWRRRADEHVGHRLKLLKAFAYK